MKEVASLHTPASQALLVISKQGSVVQQLQWVGMQERVKNRAAMKYLVCCTHFLTRHHIAHSTNFTQVDFVLSGARELQFFENASRNAAYTSRGALVYFIEALGTWVRNAAYTSQGALVDFIEALGTWVRNAAYTSRGALVDFIEALGTWVVEESIFIWIQKASVFSIMADECTNITAEGEMSVFCH